MRKEIHVSKSGNDKNIGTKESPFLSISKAAKAAEAGDKVIVHEGVYREWVKPENGGNCDTERIIYEAFAGDKVVIKGSEQIKNWTNVENTLWRADIPNDIFGDYNPYSEALFGDWFIYPSEWKVHSGDVYLNGKSLYEAKSLDEVKNPKKRTEGYNPPWTNHLEPLPDSEFSIYQWYCEVGYEFTTIYANFHGADPNTELTEINVRRSCFYPEKTGRNYITVRGFEMAQAACPWTPPTADQPGLLGANWSKGWIIEENIIHDAKCSGISIGKEASTGDNYCTKTHRKPGYQFQMESMFLALQKGWSKETIGSHIIRNNKIYDCGQNGIVGHLGGIFSKIYKNHIYGIGTKHEFFGHEIAGIKLHAAIDTQIYENNIHDCTLGVWLDWEAQGTRISKNLFFNNDRDFFIEVTHGPHIVDNNVFASEYNFDNVAQGGAFINNLFCGSMRRSSVLDRSTPYHFPHTTSPAGSAFVYSGDDRWFQNVFIGGVKIYTEESSCGTADYNGSPSSMEEYIDNITLTGIGDHDVFEKTKDPVYINNNAYFKGALSYDKEDKYYSSDEDPNVSISCEEDKFYIEMNIEKDFLKVKGEILETKDLERVRIVGAPFDDPEGNSILFDLDYHNTKRADESCVGPFSELKEGKNKILLWD